MPDDDRYSSATTEIVARQILLVEDETETAASIKKSLEERGYYVTIARDAGQAQSSFAMNKPDLILLDLILPGQSGFEICDRLKQIEKSVPILVLSAIDMDDSRRLAKKAGADGYLTKPIEPDELVKNIEQISRLARKIKQSDPSTEERNQRIHFSCRCGKRLRVSPAHRGKSLTCPDCGEPVAVPRHD